MKRIFNFFKWLFGYEVPETKELVKKEAGQIKKMQESVKNIKVIHEEISEKIDSCNPKKEPIVKKQEEIKTIEIKEE